MREVPRFTQALLETIYPHYLSPTPSMAVVRFEPTQMTEGFTIARGTALKSLIGPEEHTPCEYRTAHEVKLWPIQIVEARYFTRDMSELELPRELAGRAAFRIRMKSPPDLPLKAVPLDKLTYFLRGTDELPVAMFRANFFTGFRSGRAWTYG